MNRFQDQIDSAKLPESHVNLLKVMNTIDISNEARTALSDAIDKILEDTARRRRILTLVQDALGQLRLDMKYLMFDLEATRQERNTALEAE